MRRRSQPARSAWFKDDFADEELVVGIDRLNHQTQQARNIGRCRLETSPLLKRVIQFEGSQSRRSKAAFRGRLTRWPRRRNDHHLAHSRPRDRQYRRSPQPVIQPPRGDRGALGILVVRSISKHSPTPESAHPFSALNSAQGMGGVHHVADASPAPTALRTDETAIPGSTQSVRRTNSLVRDWSVVAATIARRSGMRSSVLDALFG